jgi:TPR repeat protein
LQNKHNANRGAPKSSNIMSSDSSSNVEISRALSLLNVDGNESNSEELEAANAEIINTASFLRSLNIGDRNERSGGEKDANDNNIINTAAICTNCGKEGDGDNMNSCNKCDLVKYCNAACKKKHKSKHKKKCERRVAELYDEKLFKEPPPPEDCPVCFLPLPSADQLAFYSCCGKDICKGCILAMVESGAKDLCPFCRTPDTISDEEIIKRTEKLMDKGNADAYYQLAGYYALGRMGMPQDRAKANELLLKAGELGCVGANCNLGNAYDNGRGVEIDKKKAMHYFELAAMNGSVKARYNLGGLENQAGNIHRSLKHFILAARAGHDKAVGMVKLGFMGGIVGKDEYANTLRAYQKSKDEVKSEARDKAAAIRGHRSAS